MSIRTWVRSGWICLCLPACGPGTSGAGPITNAVPDAARPLPLSAVRLTGGPLKHAQDLDAKYLLALEPDRMLAYYRERAGLPPKAKPYGGWDGGAKNLTGHIAGHYLSAVSLMWAATGDPRFKERADYLVRELKEVQDKHGDGFLVALEKGRESFEALAKGDIRSGGFDLNGLWSPWYVLHKTYAGLRDAWRFAGNRDALDVEVKFAAWAERTLAGLTEPQVQRMLDTEFGGMNEVFADLYADTGDPRWLALSRRFEHHAVTDALQRGEDNLEGKHGNTQIPKLLGSAARHAYTGDAADGRAAAFFWERVAHHHSFATGGHGKDEYFGKPDQLSDRIEGRTCETCNVYNMLRLTRRLFALRPDADYAEFHERALFNHILGSIDPEDGRTCYMVPVGQGVHREYADMFGNFTCCVGSGMESHALHGLGIYSEAGDRLWVNLYAPSTAEWAAAGAKLEMATDFPEGEHARLTFTLGAPREFTLALRRPAWAGAGFAVRVNGGAVPALPAPGSYVEIRRNWKSGDAVEAVLPKALHLEPLPDNPRRVAILWGPLVLAGDVEPAGKKDGGVPVFVAAGRPVEEWIKPVPGKPGEFRTDGVGRDRDVTLVPFHRLHRRAYAAYWDLFTPPEWEVKAAEHAAEQQRQRALEAATVAYAQPGEMQPERDFKYQGAADAAVERVAGRPGRSGRSWFSFELPVDGAKPMALVATYHTGPRRHPASFEILVDGTRLATQQVTAESPARFKDVEYAIPTELVQGKAKVTVRFQAATGNEIATVFGLRMIRAGAAGAQDRMDVVDRPDTGAPNTLYAGNRPPLSPSPLVALPFGAVKPQGWLRKQLELQAGGFVGHLTEISSFCNPKNNAWLSRTGEGANGWEEVPYWLRGFSAMAYVLGDPRLVAEVQPWIEAAIASQREDGYFGPRSNLKEKGDHDLMSNQNLLFTLRAHHEYTGDPRVLELMRKYFAWELAIPDAKFFSSGWQVPRNDDDMENATWLFNRTGDTNLLALTAKLQRCGATWMKIATGGHNVDFAQGFRKPAQFWPQNRDPEFLATTEKQWDSIIGLYGQVPGGAFGGDEFARPGYTDPRQAIETCGAVEMMISHQILARITGDPKWADRCEEIAFNTLPATTTADLKALRYLTSPNQVNSDARSKAPELADGGPMQVMNPHDHRCCQHNFGAGWPYFAQHAWMAAPGNGLAAVMYAPVTLTAKAGDGVPVTIVEDTHYPFEGAVTFTVTPEKPVAFPLLLRVPGWCAAGVRLTLNGKPLAAAVRPEAYLRLERTWKAGDTLRLELPTAVAVTRWKANQDSASVRRGPLTFSVKIGEKYVPHEPAKFKEPWPAWEIVPTTPWNYALQLDAANPAAAFEVVAKAWPANDMPFTHEGTPVELRAQARKLPNWKEDHLGLVDKLQPSPVKSAEPLETITLIPMGAARLRLAALPVLGTGPDAREWQLPPEPLVSYSRGGTVDPYEAMFDGKVPATSSDKKTPRFTTYCFGGAEHGKPQWVRRNFDRPTTVDSCEVFWFDESPSKGDVRLPQSWRVTYLDGKEWKGVENATGYGVDADKFNVVRFKPVTTTALRLEVQTQSEKGRYAMGILEWRIPAREP